MTRVVATAITGLGEIRPGDDLAALLTAAAGDALVPGAVVVVAHKVVSKAEGRIVDLATVTPSPQARALAREHAKDPRHVQVILDESAEIVRARAGVLICRTHHGFICANAGADASNAPAPHCMVLLPVDPDASARALRARLPHRPAVIVSDSFGRAWRHGQVDVAIGVAGLAPLDDWRGREDSVGRDLHATWIAVADEAAAAADLARRKDSREPAIVIGGLEHHVTEGDGPGVVALLRPRAEDLFA